MFFTTPTALRYVSRSDASDLLSSYAPLGFTLDDIHWPSVEHYYQGMRFTDPEQRQAIANADNPARAQELAKQHKSAQRQDWEKIKLTVMTRALYTRCHQHPPARQALLRSGNQDILENAQYDYYWGCGRDGRGHNHYGKLLMAVREKLQQESA